MEKDIFIQESIYPEPEKLFQATYKTIDKIKDDCIYILDTNVLLIPYTISNKSLSEIDRIFSRLVQEKRLGIPEQVVREFVKHRPEKIKELFQALKKKRDSISKFGGERYPLLENDPAYIEALENQKKINNHIEVYRQNLDIVLENIRSWNWNDPVSEMYRKLFDEQVVIKVSEKRDVIKKDLERRIVHKIPPGYKDSAKDDEGIGDLLIWYAVLEQGRQGFDVVLVSGDEKGDWFYRSDKQSLYPRFELIDEFRRLSNSRTLHIVKFSYFLQLVHAEAALVQEIKREEELASVQSDHFSNASFLEILNKMIKLALAREKEEQEITEHYAINVMKVVPSEITSYSFDDLVQMAKYDHPKGNDLSNYISSLSTSELRKAVGIMYTGRGDADDINVMINYVSSWDRNGCISKLIEKAPLAGYLKNGISIGLKQGIDFNNI